MAARPLRRTIDSAMTAFAADPVSPELILVSPPEVATEARAQLSLLIWEPQEVGPSRLPAIELLAVYLVCLAVTLGPLLLLVLAA